MLRSVQAGVSLSNKQLSSATHPWCMAWLAVGGQMVHLEVLWPQPEEMVV